MTESLLSRLSALNGPSRELDAEIALAFYPFLKDCPRDDSENRGGPGWMTKDGRVYAERYTESIDAAMTLLGGHGDYIYAIEKMMIWPKLPSRVTIVGVHLYDGKYWHEFEDGRWEAEAATPAIALVIACLKSSNASQ